MDSIGMRGYFAQKWLDDQNQSKPVVRKRRTGCCMLPP